MGSEMCIRDSVKAMWALGNSESVEAMKKLMLQNTASEFTE